MIPRKPKRYIYICKQCGYYKISKSKRNGCRMGFDIVICPTCKKLMKMKIVNATYILDNLLSILRKIFTK